MLDFPLIGRWPEGGVLTKWVPSSRPIVLKIEQAIETEWQRASARKGIHLFDGPMCRLESFAADDQTLTLNLSPTSYKPFVGTNMTHPEFAERFGESSLANPVGLSTAVISSDSHLLLGVRNSRVAYYPNRIHPFSGSLEPEGAADVFSEIRRELREELALDAQDIESISCLGIASDRSLRQPELMFVTRAKRDVSTLRAQLDADEHAGLWTVPLDPQRLLPADLQPFTPVGVAALLLTGRDRFGLEWFEAHRKRISAEAQRV